MKYCTYLTIYSGDILPRRYIGSCNTKNILKGYNGSISSKRWKDLYEYEQKNNKHLFKTRILKEFETHHEAIFEENKLHIKYDVVKSDLYMNESNAVVNGFFGRNVNGNNNPMYGKIGKNNPNYGKKRTKESRTKLSDSIKKYYETDRGLDKRKYMSDIFTGENNPMYGKTQSEETKQKMSDFKRGENHPLYGKHRTDDVKQKISNTRKDRDIPSPMKGRVTVIDKEGNTFSVGVDDERFINGDVSCISKGRIFSKESRNKMSESRIGYKWVHNPITGEVKMLKKDQHIQEGWCFGRNKK